MALEIGTPFENIFFGLTNLIEMERRTKAST
jgi:hypothetical protein